MRLEPPVSSVQVPLIVYAVKDWEQWVQEHSAEFISLVCN